MFLMKTEDTDQFIIDDSHGLKSGQKLTAVGITLLFWAILLYLWQPLISLLAWWLNIKLFYNHMIVLGGYQAFLEVALFYLTVIFILGGGLILWARINLWRFRGKKMRNFSGVIDDKEIRKFIGINEQQLNKLQSSRNVKLLLNDAGEIESLVTLIRKD